MSVNPNMANREVCDLIVYDYKTKKPFLNLDYANVITNELTGESVFAYGGQGHPKRVSFSGERSGTLTIETQIQTVKLWEMITGGTVSNTAKFAAREVLTVASNKVTLKDTPVSGTVVAYAANDDCGTELSPTVNGKELTFSGVTGDVVVYYLKQLESGVTRININTKSFPKAITIYGDTIMKTEDEEILPYKFVAYKAAPQPNLTLSYSNTGDPVSLSIPCDLLVDKDNNMLDLILIEEDEEAEGATGATGATGETGEE